MSGHQFGVWEVLFAMAVALGLLAGLITIFGYLFDLLLAVGMILFRILFHRATRQKGSEADEATDIVHRIDQPAEITPEVTKPQRPSRPKFEGRNERRSVFNSEKGTELVIVDIYYVGGERSAEYLNVAFVVPAGMPLGNIGLVGLDPYDAAENQFVIFGNDTERTIYRGRSTTTNSEIFTK
ncbi:hypothetical protein HGA91_01700 [candidate division WWE3 bacterium]|nr:hypothetical protein [candidate division WWE3 bacterium]